MIRSPSSSQNMRCAYAVNLNKCNPKATCNYKMLTTYVDSLFTVLNTLGESAFHRFF